MAAAAEPPPPPPTTPEVFQWLKNLPLAPEYHPTLAEFQDPIAYIFKIEKEASTYGICKIVPPVLSSSKKTAIANLNRSLAARSGVSGLKSSPTFTTRQQQIGFCPRKPRPVQKPVWQSGEKYTFQEFEAKAKSFEKNYFKKCTKKGPLSPLEIETLYWKATIDKPFSVEYANDMPGSAFSPRKSGGKEAGGGMGEGVTVGETEWNMRGVSRAKGSLLRFMKEEIPGVTSPMVYIGMMFSWFAWHVEDHDFHSLNYMHMGAGKTWYGVPREAAVAFEEVVRVHGYGGEINPLVTFAVLGEKTTVMSPEVFISAGIPCCRLVQNAGEFVVTFPRAYHSGFSHGFNCGEAANIATPEWLRVAKDSAIRRASINYPPMVSHFQLLYDLVLELCTRIPLNISAKPRSSRLKDKQKGEGEVLVRELFVNNVRQNNGLLHILGKGSSIVLLPRSSSDISVCSNLRVGSKLRENPSLGLCSHKDFMISSKSSVSDNSFLASNHETHQVTGFFSKKAKFASLCERNWFPSVNGNDCRQTENTNNEGASAMHDDKLPGQRLFSCVTCGILSFDCLAIIQPREAAARYLMSADCSFFNDWTVGPGVTSDVFAIAGGDANTSELDSSSRSVERNIIDGLYDVPVQSVTYHIQKADQRTEVDSDTEPERVTSALGLLAMTYGNSSDSEEDQIEPDDFHNEINRTNSSLETKYHCLNSALSSLKPECNDGATGSQTLSQSRLDCGNEVPLHATDCYTEHRYRPADLKDRSDQMSDCSHELLRDKLASMESKGLEGSSRDPMSRMTSNCSPVVHDTEKSKFSRSIVEIESADMSFAQRSDEDSSRMHVFCLEHAVEVEQQLRPIGGVHILLLCHPEYPRVEAEAKRVSEDLGIDNLWNDITFRDATKEDEERIQSALDSEEAIPGNGDWAVKLGINLFYSANLSWSPLYSKQMPYNSVIYNAFGRTSPAGSPAKFNVYGRRTGKPRKVVAGKWCGKVWMSNQVHPFLAKQDSEDQDQEQDRSFPGQAMPNERLERKAPNIHKTDTTFVSGKSGRKRKVAAESGSVKKLKCVKTDDAASGDSMEDNLCKQHMRSHNSKHCKSAVREVSYDLLEDSFHQHHGRIRGSKKAKSVEGEDAVSDDSLGENIHQQYNRILGSKQRKSIGRENLASYTLMENNSLKQYRRTRRSNQDKCVESKDAVSEDSLDDKIRHWHGSVPGSRKTKTIEREDAVSDGSLEESSHWPRATVCRSKQAKYMEKEDSVSDDSLENRSHSPGRRISRGSQAKYVERDNTVSDDSLDETTYKQHTVFPRSKQDKFFDREDAISDDSLEENTHHHRRILMSKQAKFFESEDGVSDDSLEDNTYQQRRRISRSERVKSVGSEDRASDDLMLDDSHQQHRRIPRGKKAQFSQREDVISDDMQEDDTYQQPRKTPRGKQSKLVESEDEVSDDLHEDNTRWHPRKNPGGKQSKFVETEYEVSDDLQEDNTHRQPRKTPRGKQSKFVDRDDELSDDLPEDSSKQQHRRILRSKEKKPVTLRQMKQSTPQNVKQGTPRLIKRGTPQLIKQEKKVKQETPRLLNDKSGQNAKPLDSYVEEVQEGGPSTRLRKRPPKPLKESEIKQKEKLPTTGKRVKNALAAKAPASRKNVKMKAEEAEYQCDIEGCTMSFGSKQELSLHKRNVCPVKGCGKKFFSHKYLVQHRRVHLDDRPLKCPWKGCKMTFKWAWARTEHIRVHTGARPYVCAEEGCGQTFRFVSDFSRHKRKTGHSAKKGR